MQCIKHGSQSAMLVGKALMMNECERSQACQVTHNYILQNKIRDAADDLNGYGYHNSPYPYLPPHACETSLKSSQTLTITIR